MKENNVTRYYSELAKKHNLDYAQLDKLQEGSSLLNIDKRLDYIRLQALPIAQTEKTVTVATANPTSQNQKEIIAFFGIHHTKEVKIVVASRQDIVTTLANRFEKEYTHIMTHARDDADLFHSASYTFTLIEKIVLILILVALVIAALGNFFATALWFNVFLATGTLIVMSYKMGLTIHSLRFVRTKPEIMIEPQADYPMYTVLLPLLHEKEITITLLLESLSRIDYPVDKLDIKFLLEQDDKQTLEILKKFDLPWYYHVVIVPSGFPRSKPRACNYGLQFSFGKYLTIYDAEDRPDSDQLKKALQVFMDSPPKVACLQSALNFYNYRENLLTRLFTIEYTYWFDCLIPALDSLGSPVPLGGTSNHFKVLFLRKIRGWDPYIGTEDAEIGVRLYRHGFRVESLHSTTYEEANSKLLNWFLQRARWNKGYMQTYLVNMRDPMKMIREVGPWRFLSFQFFVGGNVFIQLANLPLWIFFFTTIFFYNSPIISLYPKLILYMTWFNFLVSNGILLASQFAAVYYRRIYCLLPYVPLKLLYWLLMSFAGYYAVIELLIRPGYWYKTEHGLSKEGKNTDIPF